MKHFKMSLIIIVLSVILVSCGNKKETEKEPKETSQEHQVSNNEPLVIDVKSGDYKNGKLVIKYPILAELNNEKKAKSINELILKDIETFVEQINNSSSDEKVSGEITYEYSIYDDKVLSIYYIGDAFVEGGAYPISQYHTLNIGIESLEKMKLSEIINIDMDFVESLKRYGMYASIRDDLNLEESGIDVMELITSNYSDSELLEGLTQEDASFFMEDIGMVFSFEVPHAEGDHIEIALNYECFEEYFNKEHVIWTDYMYLNGEPEDTDAIEYDFYGHKLGLYGVSYPAIYDSFVESDSGDGITLSTNDGRHTFTIWGYYNILDDTAESLLESSKKRYDTITYENVNLDQNSYRLESESNETDIPMKFVEYGLTDNERTVIFIISYAKDEEETYIGIIDAIIESLNAQG